MSKDELNHQIDILQREFDSEVLKLKRQYCDENNPFKIGDKFTDHIGSIIIEKIKYSYDRLPCCVYFGVELKKDGTPRKDENKRKAWQSNDIKIFRK